MKKIFLLALIFAGFASNLYAQIHDNIYLKDGSVLVYNITAGAKKYTYTVTYKTLPTSEVQLSWQTNEKPKARKGTSVIIQYYSLYSKEILIDGFANGLEKLKQEQTRILIPQTLDNYIAEVEDDASETFTINENGKATTFAIEDVTIKDYQSKTINYNGQNVNAEYDEVLMNDGNRILGMVKNSDKYERFLCYYKSEAITMELVSIKTPVTTKVQPVIVKPIIVKPISTTPQKMEATKLKTVTKDYPLLATVENYDPTNGGKVPKPFTETYEFRLSSGSPNPPSAIDCFTADLKILYNQKKNFGLESLTETIDTKVLPKKVAAALLDVYVKTAARSTPGYKPYTHNKFVTKLTDKQRQQLASELEAYIKKYGFTE